MNLSIIQSAANSLNSQLESKTKAFSREQKGKPTIGENAFAALIASAEGRRQGFHREVAGMVKVFEDLSKEIGRIMNDKDLTGDGKFNAKLPLLRATDTLIQRDLARRVPGIDDEIRNLELKIKLQTISLGNAAADEAKKIEIRSIVRDTDPPKLKLQYIEACKNTDLWLITAIDEAVPPLLTLDDRMQGLEIRKRKEATHSVYSIEYLEILRDHFLLLHTRCNNLLADLGFSSDAKMKPQMELARQKGLAEEAYKQRLERKRKHAREQKRLGV